MADETVKVEFCGHLRRLDIKPGDKLVLSVDEDISEETAEQLKAHCLKVIGLDLPVLIIGPGIQLGCVRVEE